MSGVASAVTVEDAVRVLLGLFTTADQECPPPEEVLDLLTTLTQEPSLLTPRGLARFRALVGAVDQAIAMASGAVLAPHAPPSSSAAPGAGGRVTW